ncbi:MAG TPA: ABC transporter permease subunit [Solirubrobacteraceae bacterium]|nr:ABC transporter permease subunit [Solirubrobacteraceae bacterium]
MNVDLGRVRAVFRKELRQFRRNRTIVITMGILPLLFLTGPMINIFSLSASSSASTVRSVTGSVLLLMLIVPVILPAAVSAYSVVGERDQGTLEPLLTTPVRRGELMLGKGLAAVLPATAVTYVLYVAFIVAVRLWAAHAVFSEIWQVPPILAEVLFAPLLATWSVCVGMAVSVRSTDVRVAQQLSTLASLPPLGLAILITFRVIAPTVLSAVAIGLALVVLDCLAGWIASLMLDRERLIVGRRAPRRERTGGA